VPGLLAGLALLALAGVALDANRILGRLSGPAFTAWEQAVTDWHYSDGSNSGAPREFLTRELAGHGELKAVFIGDSHMQQYWPRVLQIAKTHPAAARPAILIIYYGCPPLPGINSVRRGRNCSGFFDYAMQQALRADVDTVVFGAFWEKYLAGEYSVPGSAEHIYPAGDPARATLRFDSAATHMVLEQFRAAVARLVARGRRVYILLSNPTSPQFDPASMLPSQLRLSPHLPAGISLAGGRRIDAGAFETYVQPLMSQLRTIAAETGATAVDPRATLCDGLLCPATGADGLPLYLDSNHLRACFTREQASFVDEMLLGAAAQ
jgi:hypothetical protein